MKNGASANTSDVKNSSIFGGPFVQLDSDVVSGGSANFVFLAFASVDGWNWLNASQIVGRICNGFEMDNL